MQMYGLIKLHMPLSKSTLASVHASASIKPSTARLERSCHDEIEDFDLEARKSWGSHNQHLHLAVPLQLPQAPTLWNKV